MPTSLYVPGPAQVALGTSGGTVAYLGYSERGVEIDERFLTMDVHADYGGPMMPVDKMHAGKILLVSMQLIRFDPLVFNQVLARTATGTMGQLGPNEIGTLLWTEGQTFHLMIRSARQAALSAGIYANMLPGVNVPKCVPIESISMPISTAPQVLPLVFWATADMVPATQAGSLWDHDMTGFPTPS